MLTLQKWVWLVTPNFMHGWIRNVFFVLRLAPNIWYDAMRFYRYSGINKSREFQSEQAARITMAYHQIEKGLSYAAPRPGFGVDVVARLFSAIEPYVKQHGLIAPATTALGVLQAYVAFNESVQIDMSAVKLRLAKIEQSFTAICLKNENSTFAIEGGVIAVSRQQLALERAAGFVRFFNSRYSVRHFTGGIVTDAEITAAISIALKTPSVCNRQSWKVHAYNNKAYMQQLLNIQSGSRGFGEQASTVLIITSDLSSFVDVSERYQAWIDGGMFSMSVCLSLHAQGLGTCCLNWSKLPADDITMRKVANIMVQEQIIMLVAVGTLPEQFNVAYSARKPIDQDLRFHSSNTVT